MVFSSGSFTFSRPSPRFGRPISSVSDKSTAIAIEEMPLARLRALAGSQVSRPFGISVFMTLLVNWTSGLDI